MYPRPVGGRREKRRSSLQVQTIDRPAPKPLRARDLACRFGRLRIDALRRELPRAPPARAPARAPARLVASCTWHPGCISNATRRARRQVALQRVAPESTRPTARSPTERSRPSPRRGLTNRARPLSSPALTPSPDGQHPSGAAAAALVVSLRVYSHLPDRACGRGVSLIAVVQGRPENPSPVPNDRSVWPALAADLCEAFLVRFPTGPCRHAAISTTMHPPSHVDPPLKSDPPSLPPEERRHCR